MNDLRILGVQIIERIEKLIGPRQYLIRRKGAAFARYHLGQIIARNKLHYEKLTVAFGKVVAHTRQGGMVHARQQPCLPLKLLS